VTSESPAITTAIPDLRSIPVDRLAELGGPGLARAIERYQERLAESGVPLSSFQARI
jgi:FXSXX-COOH protein